MATAVVTLISAASATLTTEEKGGYDPARQSIRTTAGRGQAYPSSASLHAHLHEDLHVLMDSRGPSSCRIACNCAESAVQDLLENWQESTSAGSAHLQHKPLYMNDICAPE